MMHGASGIHRVDLTPLTLEEVTPTIQFKSAVMVVKPTESKISPLTQRDVIPHGRQIYQNLLTYNVQVAKSQEISFAVPLFTSVLYESEFESQFFMCFDANKVLVACGDAYSGKNFTKLSKGDYVIRLQVRHERKELLEKISEATLLITFKLSSSLGMDIFPSYKAALLNEKKLSSVVAEPPTVLPMYLAPLAVEKLAKAVPNQCSWLQGTLTTNKDERVRKVDNHRFDYFLPENSLVKKNGAAPKNNGNKSKLDEYKEGLREFQSNQIAKLGMSIRVMP